MDGRRNHRNKTTLLTCSADGASQEAESIACTITFYINRPDYLHPPFNFIPISLLLFIRYCRRVSDLQNQLLILKDLGNESEWR